MGNETALPVIATVSTKDRDYSASPIGDAVLDGVDTYYLSLVPLRRPKVNRLPRQAVLAGNFTMAPLIDVPWMVGFSVINGAPFTIGRS